NYDNLLDGDSHAAGGACDDTGSVIHTAGVQILEFPSGNVLNLSHAHLESLVLAAPLGLLLRWDQFAALFLFQRNPGGLLEKHGGGRTLGNELKAAVRVNRNNHRHGDAAHVLGPVIKLAYESPDIDPVLAERRPHGRSGRSLSTGNLQTNLG